MSKLLRPTLLVCAFLLVLSGLTFAQTAPNLSSAACYAAFSAEGNITNTGPSWVIGDLGAEDNSVNGFPAGHYCGVIRDHENPDAETHKNELIAAFNQAGDEDCNYAICSTIGNGLSLSPGVYCSPGNETLSGVLTLNAHGDSNAVFLIKVNGALCASSNSSVVLSGGALAKNVFWYILGTTNVFSSASFKGSILGAGTIHLYGGCKLEGRAIALVGDVILENCTLNVPESNLPSLTVLRPAAGDTVIAGTTNYQIQFTGTSLTPQKSVEYSLDGGMTWTIAGALNSNVNSFSWNVPDTSSTKAIIRITDNNGVSGESGVFSIVSHTQPSVVIIHPSQGEIVTGLSNYEITWVGSELTTQKILEYSFDGGMSWKIIGIISGNVSQYAWSVPDTNTSSALIRLVDLNGTTGVSGNFSIVSKPKSWITITHPNAGEILVGGTPDYVISWTGSGIANGKVLESSFDSGATWQVIAVLNSDVNQYVWGVPDTNVSHAFIRITDVNGLSAKSGAFSIQRQASAFVMIVRPSTGESIAGGTVNYPIVYTGAGLTAQKIVEYSLDGGISWSLVGIVNSETNTIPWSVVPNQATTKGLIRIIDLNGVMGTSGLFTITSSSGSGGNGAITMLCLGGLIDNNIPNGKHMTIDWQYSGSVGDSVAVSYSLDGETWKPITTMSTSAVPHTVWTTLETGRYDSVRIRVMSNTGISATSNAFSIGATTLAGVTANVIPGMSLTNYPNPANGVTTISFELPKESEANLSLIDMAGHTVFSTDPTIYSSGHHDIPVNVSELAAGVYTCLLRTQSGLLVGRMNIVR